MDTPSVGVIRRRILVSGRVQGVGFRQSCLEVAYRHGVQGWARNRRDGRVEAVLEGSSPGVHAVVDWCRHGPPAALVTDVEVLDEQPGGESLVGFRVAATL